MNDLQRQALEAAEVEFRRLAHNSTLIGNVVKAQKHLNLADQLAAALVSEQQDTAAVAERKWFVGVLESFQVSVGNSSAGEIAAEMTIGNLRDIREIVRERSTSTQHAE